MKMKPMKNADGDRIYPSNVILHQNESQMIFSDAKDVSQLFDLDLETGKIVE